MLKNRPALGPFGVLQHFPGWLRACFVTSGALGLMALFWGFTVDDSWIVARVAAHGLSGKGFEFNPGVKSDAVTPLGFAHFLAAWGALFDQQEPLELWRIARLSGGAAVLFCCASIGWSCRTQAAAFWWQAPPWILGAMPLFVWAGAGLATPLVAALVYVGGTAIERGRRPGGAFVLGCAAALRPELCFFGATLLVLTGLGSNPSGGRTMRPAALQKLVSAGLAFALPVLTVVGIRLACFGHPLPLSALAKEPDFSSGLRYASVTALWFPLGWALFFRKEAYRTGLAGSYLAHLLGLVFVGGDWMPAFRLSVPLVPLLLRWHLNTPLQRHSWVILALVPIFPVLLLAQQGNDLRLVTERRLSLVATGQRALGGAHNVAAVDIGWVGLAHPGQITDLAGVTDPRIAALPGGHTSKRVAPGLFSDRGVDAWVVRDLARDFVPLRSELGLIPAYAVDARLLQGLSNLHLAPKGVVPLLGTRGQYVIFRDDPRRHTP